MYTLYNVDLHGQVGTVHSSDAHFTHKYVHTSSLCYWYYVNMYRYSIVLLWEDCN